MHGYRTITRTLTKEGHKINKNTVHSIMDLYNGEIIAYTIGSKQDISFVLDTLDQLPKLKDSCILHTDQDTSRPYQVQVNKKGITMSMSRKGTPSDNAPIEAFHFNLKSETFYRYPDH